MEGVPALGAELIPTGLGGRVNSLWPQFGSAVSTQPSGANCNPKPTELPLGVPL